MNKINSQDRPPDHRRVPSAHVRYARLCLLCEIGADNHLKKTAGLCKKIAKSFVKRLGDIPIHSRRLTRLAGLLSMAQLRRGLIRPELSAADQQPAPMLTSCYGHDVGD